VASNLLGGLGAQIRLRGKSSVDHGSGMNGAKHALVLGAGASLAAPAGRPLFAALRQALSVPLQLDIDDVTWASLAPEVLLSRLAAAGIDIDSELRAMLRGGKPNAVHLMAVYVLGRGQSVWTTNFDELIEAAAFDAGVAVHVLLPGDGADCRCMRGHLVKVHGTLSGGTVLARSEDVLRPLPQPLVARLRADLAGALVGVIGYAGADIDLRTGLREALCDAVEATWFCRPEEEASLRLRFSEPINSGKLALQIGSRPDLDALAWGKREHLTAEIPRTLLRLAGEPIEHHSPVAAYRPNALVRARVLDDFGRPTEARLLYAKALRSGPRRRTAARALYTSGLIHETPWRGSVVASLNMACRSPAPWRWPHLQRLPYLTWNVAPDKRLAILEQSLRRIGPEPRLLQATANAAKEVDPRRAVELGLLARKHARARGTASALAWSSFTLSFALRWLGDIDGAGQAASELTDGVDALAGPRWVAWGHFEAGANAALRGQLLDAAEHMSFARDVFEAGGSMFAFDAWCALIAIHRAAGDLEAQRNAYAAAKRLLDADSLRQRFKRDVLLAEEGEYARDGGDLENAEYAYAELSGSPTLAQELLGLLGLGEVQRARDEQPSAAWRALARSKETSFGYGEVHAAVTLGLAGAIGEDEAERLIREADSIRRQVQVTVAFSVFVKALPRRNTSSASRSYSAPARGEEGRGRKRGAPSA
jgi:hypothetical protein